MSYFHLRKVLSSIDVMNNIFSRAMPPMPSKKVGIWLRKFSTPYSGMLTTGMARARAVSDCRSSSIIVSKVPEMLSAWQRIFCASCPGTQWEEDVRAADASER